MWCVTTVTYNVVHGGRELGPVTPTRGIRQGDPLSPYLFILCVEGLSTVIQKSEARGHWRACKVGRGAPSVSHMFFADDSYLYCKANEASTATIIRVIESFEKPSGQKVNLGKSLIFFS